jgi:hypothetical protein
MLQSPGQVLLELAVVQIACELLRRGRTDDQAEAIALARVGLRHRESEIATAESLFAVINDLAPPLF